MKFISAIIRVIGIICILLLPSRVTRADVAPPPAPGIGGLEPFEYQKTNVQMTYERVEMELVNEVEKADVSERPHVSERVRVNAWFVLNNQGSEDETMQVIFPLGNFNQCIITRQNRSEDNYLASLYDTFTASVDGTPAEVKTVTTDHPHKGQINCTNDDYTMDWAAFDVRFPPGKDVVVRVSYLLHGNGSPITEVMYVLETGRGWKGPIKQGHVIFRFPYMVEDNILKGTTPGYQKLYNEIYWSFENLEPSDANNIFITYIGQETWKKITNNRERIQKDASDVEAWRELADSYYNIGHWHGPNIADEEYAQRVYATYNTAIQKNPNSGALYAGLAELYWSDCCYYFPPVPSDMAKILPLVDKALQLDPANEQALEILDSLQQQVPDLNYTQPVTFTPTITLTPTITATREKTKTPRSTDTAEASAPSPRPTIRATSSPTATNTPSATSTQDHATLTVTPAPTKAASSGAPGSLGLYAFLIIAVTVSAVAFVSIRMRRKPVR